RLQQREKSDCAGFRIRHRRIQCPRGLDLRGGQARWTVAAFACEYFRIEMALPWVLDHPVPYAIEGVTSLKHSIVNHRIFFRWNVAIRGPMGEVVDRDPRGVKEHRV